MEIKDNPLKKLKNQPEWPKTTAQPAPPEPSADGLTTSKIVIVDEPVPQPVFKPIDI